MRDRRWLSCAAILVASATCAGQTGPSTVGASTAAALLKDSEIHHVESGGVAGRVHEAHFQAVDARVTVQYRAPDLHIPQGLQAGNVENDAYLALWHEAERLELWTVTSPPRSPGADLVQSELRIRQGTRSHTIRWDEGSSSSERLRDVSAWARRVLAVGREYAANR